MPCIARTVIPGVPRHITQRGNNRQDVFFVELPGNHPICGEQPRARENGAQSVAIPVVQRRGAHGRARRNGHTIPGRLERHRNAGIVEAIPVRKSGRRGRGNHPCENVPRPPARQRLLHQQAGNHDGPQSPPAPARKTAKGRIECVNHP